MIVRHAGDERGDDGRRGGSDGGEQRGVAGEAVAPQHLQGPRSQAAGYEPDDHERLAVQG